MKPSGGTWLILTGALYIELLIMNVLAGYLIPSDFIQFSWIIVMSLPLFVTPMAHFLNVKSIWEEVWLQ